MKLLVSNDVKELTSSFRKLLSGKNAPIQQVVDCGVVPCLIRFLQFDDNPALQFEAAGAVAMITSSKTSDHIKYVIDAGAVPIFVRLLSSTSEDVRAEAAYALGNITSNSVDKVLAAGALPALLQACENSHEQSRLAVVRPIARALSNLCRGKPAPDLLVVQPVLPLLARLLSSQDIETAEAACSAFQNISARGETGIQAILEVGIVPKLIELLNHTSTKILAPAIRTVFNIINIKDNTSQTQLILSYNVLPCLLTLLNHQDKNIRMDLCQVISNIIANDQIQAVIDAGIFPKLFELLKAPNVDIQEEAAYTICDTILHGNPSQVWYLIDEGVIPPLCNLLLQVNNIDLVEIVLEGLEKMLNKDYNFDQLEIIVKEICNHCDGMKKLQKFLQEPQNNSNISNSVKNIIELAFGTHLISDDSNENPLASIRYYRNILSIGKMSPVQQIIESGVVPYFIRFSQIDDNPTLKLEANWALINIINNGISQPLTRSFDSLSYVVNAGPIPILIQLLSSTNEELRAQAAWSLGTIIGNREEFYRLAVPAGAFSALIDAAEKNACMEIMYAISKTCFGGPFLNSYQEQGRNIGVILPVIPLLARLLYSQDDEVVKYSFISIRSIARGSDHCIDAILEEHLGIMPRLVELLVGSTSTFILSPALLCLGTIAYGDKLNDSFVLTALPALLWLLDHPDKEVRLNTCNTLADMTRSKQKRIQAVIDAAIFPKLFQQLKSEDISFQKTGMRVIENVTKGTSEQVMYMINEGVIPLLSDLLRDGRGWEVLSAILQAISDILDAVKKKEKLLKKVIRILSDCGGSELISKMVDHSDDLVCEKASAIKEIIEEINLYS